VKTIKGRILYIKGCHVLLYKNLSFYNVDLNSGATELIASIPVRGVKRLLGKWRLCNRLLRLEPRCVGPLNNHRFVVSILGKLWLVDTEGKNLSLLAELRTGYGLVSFCSNNNGLYWGDYGANPNHDEINIYRIDSNLNINVVYSFSQGSIRHIHTIIKDNDSFIVMAGDNEPEAGIYEANFDWTDVKPWKIGEQKYRAVVGFSYKGGLLYATDSVETENHLWYIEADGTEHELTSINGSCIYGAETKDYFLFSTTVESHEGGGIRRLLSNELGGGIKSKDVHIIAVSKKDLSVRIIKKYKKDIWPMKLFQYGRAPFAGGQTEVTDGVWCYPIACKGTKGQSEYIKL
jgi:hypothetical protein